MEAIADATGGCICVDDNDLSDCVKRAVKDSSFFYEISYYPDSKDWRGEFRKIVIKAKQPGIHLGYRRGYYANPEPLAEQDPKTGEEQLQKAACADLLTSTSILLGAKALPEEKAGTRKYFLVVDTSTVGLAESNGSSHALALQFAACTFDKTGQPLQFWHDAVNQELTAQQSSAVQAGHGYPHILAITPAADAVAVRLLVRDLTTSRVGSVNLPLLTASSPISAAGPN